MALVVEAVGRHSKSDTCSDHPAGSVWDRVLGCSPGDTRSRSFCLQVSMRFGWLFGI